MHKNIPLPKVRLLKNQQCTFGFSLAEIRGGLAEARTQRSFRNAGMGPTLRTWSWIPGAIWVSRDPKCRR
jgi:hypothetical protein